MNNPFMEQRVSELEISSAQLKEAVYEVSRLMAQNSLETRENLDRLSLEMREFKDEMARNSRETRENLDRLSLEMREFKDEMREFKDEMSKFKKEMSDSKKRMEEEQRRFNLELGNIANRQGRMTEDIVAPSICRVMKEALEIDEDEECIPNIRIIRRFKGKKGKTREFDVIAECREYVLVNETKNNPNAQDVDNLLQTISVVRDYFPEFHDRKIVGAIASLHVAPSVVNYATSKGVLALAVGDELMDIQNPPGFKLAIW